MAVQDSLTSWWPLLSNTGDEANSLRPLKCLGCGRDLGGAGFWMKYFPDTGVKLKIDKMRAFAGSSLTGR